MRELAYRDSVTLLPRTTAFGYFPHNLIGSQRAAQRPSGNAHETASRASGCGRCGRAKSFSRPARLSGRWCFRAMIGRASCWPARRRPILNAVRRARRESARSSSPRATALWRRAGFARGRRSSRRDRRPAEPRRVRSATGRRRRNRAHRNGVQVLGTLGTRGCAACRRAAGAPHERIRLRPAVLSRRLHAIVHLFSQSRRGKPRFDARPRQAFVPGESAEGERSAGACRGIFDLVDVLADGYAAGTMPPTPRARACPPCNDYQSRCAPAWHEPAPLPAEARPDEPSSTFARCHGEGLALATREGFRSIEHVKRYTTTGMATDQGKTSNINALAIVAADARSCRSRRSG